MYNCLAKDQPSGWEGTTEKRDPTMSGGERRELKEKRNIKRDPSLHADLESLKVPEGKRTKKRRKTRDKCIIS